MNLLKSLMISATAAAMFAVSPAKAVEIPCETAQLIVPWKAGGDTHILFSIFEKTIQDMGVKPGLKIVTIPGQGGNKGAKEAAKAKPDGCTLFAIHQSAITSFLNGRIDFHFDGMETVALLTSSPDVLGASKDAPFDTFEQFKKDALEHPDTVKVGATFGSTSQFVWLLLEDKTGMKLSYVPYEGTRERMTALLSNAVQLGSLTVAASGKYLATGELKPLAIAADKRAKQLPDVPTLKELGVDLVYALRRGVMAPKGTPKEVVDYWAQIFKKAAENPALLKQMDAKGTDIEWIGPEDFRKWADKTFADYKKVAIKIGMYKEQ